MTWNDAIRFLALHHHNNHLKLWFDVATAVVKLLHSNSLVLLKRSNPVSAANVNWSASPGLPLAILLDLNLVPLDSIRHNPNSVIVLSCMRLTVNYFFYLLVTLKVCHVLILFPFFPSQVFQFSFAFFLDGWKRPISYNGWYSTSSFYNWILPGLIPAPFVIRGPVICAISRSFPDTLGALWPPWPHKEKKSPVHHIMMLFVTI